MNTSIYNKIPLQTQVVESYQNFGGNKELNKLDADALKKEYSRTLSECLELEAELVDTEKEKMPTFSLKEMIQEASRRAHKIEIRLLEEGVSREEIKQLRDAAESRYKQKDDKKEDDDEDLSNDEE